MLGWAGGVLLGYEPDELIEMLTPPRHDSGDIYVAGGYGGGANYLATVEVFRANGGRDEGRGWAAVGAQEGRMQVPRTGFGMAWGPDRCFYVAGQSRLSLFCFGAYLCGG